MYTFNPDYLNVTNMRVTDEGGFLNVQFRFEVKCVLRNAIVSMDFKRRPERSKEYF